MWLLTGRGRPARAPPCPPRPGRPRQRPATWPSPPVRRAAGACCSRRGAGGRARSPGARWAEPGKPSPWDSGRDSRRVLRGRCNRAAPAAALLEDGKQCEPADAPLPTAPSSARPRQASGARTPASAARQGEAPAPWPLCLPQAFPAHDHEVPEGRGDVASASESLYIFKLKKRLCDGPGKAMEASSYRRDEMGS